MCDLFYLVEHPVCNVVVEAVGTKIKVIVERRLRGQLNHHAEGAEDHTHQGHYTRVIKVAHDSKLLTKVLVLLEEDVLLVWPSEHLHCHWNVIICPPVNLKKEDFTSLKQYNNFMQRQLTFNFDMGI